MAQFVHSLVLWFLPYLGPDDSALRRRDREDWFDGLVRELGMTPHEWLTSDDPLRMLELVRVRASGRKLRLFACACCRRVSHLFANKYGHRLLYVAEQYAEGNVSRQALQAAQDALGSGGAANAAQAASRQACYALSGGDVVATVRDAALALGYETAYRGGTDGWGAPRAAAVRSEKEFQARLARDVLGNLFHTVALDPGWLSPRSGLVKTMARTIYEERRFDELPILADALEDAGCDNVDILSHCRRLGPHARGCWVLDLILGKS